MQSLKNRLRHGGSVRAAWVSFPSVEVMDIAAKAELDFVVIDLEHSHIGWQKCADMIKIGRMQNVPVVVRVGELNEYHIKRALDDGANGLIVPNIESKNQLERLRSYAFYPPEGRRGVGLGFANGYGKNFREYYQDSKDTVILGMIETKLGAENADEIMSAGILDGYIIGPYDLSASLGDAGNFDTEKFAEAVKRINKNAEMFNIPSGIHVVSSDTREIEKASQDGFRIICCSVDFMILRRYYQEVKEVGVVK